VLDKSGKPTGNLEGLLPALSNALPKIFTLEVYLSLSTANQFAFCGRLANHFCVLTKSSISRRETPLFAFLFHPPDTKIYERIPSRFFHRLKAFFSRYDDAPILDVYTFLSPLTMSPPPSFPFTRIGPSCDRYFLWFAVRQSSVFELSVFDGVGRVSFADL